VTDVRLEDQSPRAAIERAVTVWYALLGGIGSWTVHLLFFAGWVRYSCNSGATWALHAVTVVTVLTTLLAMYLAWRIVQQGGDEEDTDDAAGRSAFLGRLALIVGAFSLALILLEELYAVLLSGNRCG
jgi:hypothetical protein